jgi:hypothetical protein
MYASAWNLRLPYLDNFAQGKLEVYRTGAGTGKQLLFAPVQHPQSAPPLPRTADRWWVLRGCEAAKT